jgi:3D (Asp-Asp-Asp) domain-containing protein
MTTTSLTLQRMRTLRALGHTRTATPSAAEQRAAVRAFQATNGLKPDGVLGPITGARLDAYTAVLTGEHARAAGFDFLQHQCYVWRFTRYYIAEETAPAGARRTPIYTGKGAKKRLLGYGSPQFFAQSALEGSGRTRLSPPGGATIEQALINVEDYVDVEASEYADVLAIARQAGWLPDKPGYAGLRVGKTPGGEYYVKQARSFRVVPPENIGVGYGSVAGRAHAPLKTLATDVGVLTSHDPAYKGKGGVVPRGTWCFLPHIVGKPVPAIANAGLTTHNGVCQAVDTGGGIDGNQADFFTGTKEIARAFFVFDRGYLWYSGIEQRLPFGYRYGS